MPSRETVSALLLPGFGRYNFPSDDPGLQIVGSVAHMRELAVRILRITGVNDAQGCALEEILRRSRLSATPSSRWGRSRRWLRGRRRRADDARGRYSESPRTGLAGPSRLAPSFPAGEEN